jgi:nucleoid-associated protein YgaU
MPKLMKKKPGEQALGSQSDIQNMVLRLAISLLFNYLTKKLNEKQKQKKAMRKAGKLAGKGKKIPPELKEEIEQGLSRREKKKFAEKAEKVKAGRKAAKVKEKRKKHRLLWALVLLGGAALLVRALKSEKLPGAQF